MTSAKAQIIVEAMISKDPVMANLLKEALSVLYDRGLGIIMVEDLHLVFIHAQFTHIQKNASLPDLP